MTHLIPASFRAQQHDGARAKWDGSGAGERWAACEDVKIQRVQVRSNSARDQTAYLETTIEPSN